MTIRDEIALCMHHNNEGDEWELDGEVHGNMPIEGKITIFHADSEQIICVLPYGLGARITASSSKWILLFLLCKAIRLSNNIILLAFQQDPKAVELVLGFLSFYWTSKTLYFNKREIAEFISPVLYTRGIHCKN